MAVPQAALPRPSGTVAKLSAQVIPAPEIFGPNREPPDAGSPLGGAWLPEGDRKLVTKAVKRGVTMGL